MPTAVDEVVVEMQERLLRLGQPHHRFFLGTYQRTTGAVGKAVDGAMDPLSYVLPFLWTGVGMSAGDTLNDRSLNLDLFQGFEESVVDMYSAVRHGYLRRREQVIKE